MRKLADEELAKDRKFVVIDMVAPLNEMRELIDPDMLIWVDTISQGRYEDTNRVFETPVTYDVRVTEQDAQKWSKVIYEKISHKI
jgi:adenylylsulfate kinase